MSYNLHNIKSSPDKFRVAHRSGKIRFVHRKPKIRFVHRKPPAQHSNRNLFSHTQKTGEGLGYGNNSKHVGNKIGNKRGLEQMTKSFSRDARHGNPHQVQHVQHVNPHHKHNNSVVHMFNPGLKTSHSREVQHVNPHHEHDNSRFHMFNPFGLKTSHSREVQKTSHSREVQHGNTHHNLFSPLEVPGNDNTVHGDLHKMASRVSPIFENDIKKLFNPQEHKQQKELKALLIEEKKRLQREEQRLKQLKEQYEAFEKHDHGVNKQIKAARRDLTNELKHFGDLDDEWDFNPHDNSGVWDEIMKAASKDPYAGKDPYMGHGQYSNKYKLKF